ncbi:MAG: putative TetR-family transcriptional regulator [Nocardioidaceae bacterium]|nr:putative TetR-family transcriptional regulator [Nocardioidaceae bacterium]
MTDTRERLLEATLQTLRERGIAGLSARTIAATAGVNQALVFYHFKTVDQLVVEASKAGARERADSYRTRFAAVTSLRGLLALGRELHEEESERGNVTVLAQVLAGARHDERLVPAAREALGQWVDEIEPVLSRLLEGSPLAEAIDVPGLARGIAAAFIGLELYDGVDPEGSDQAFAALDQLGVLVDVFDDLGAAGRLAVRRRVRRAKRD